MLPFLYMRFSPYSFSKLSVFENCPQRFKFQYIDKIPQEKRSDSLIKGSNTHSILEHIGRDDLSNISKTDRELNIVKSYIQSDIAKKYLDALKGVKQSYREISIAIDQNFKPCEYKDKNALFRGKVDFVCVVDDVLNICDYKTGKYKDLKYQDYRQLIFYAIYFFIKYKIDKIRISFIYVEHSLENEMILERKYFDNYLSLLKTMIFNVENATSYEKKTTFCKYCPYLKYCQNQ